MGEEGIARIRDGPLDPLQTVHRTGLARHTLASTLAQPSMRRARSASPRSENDSPPRASNAVTVPVVDRGRRRSIRTNRSRPQRPRTNRTAMAHGGCRPAVNADGILSATSDGAGCETDDHGHPFVERAPVIGQLTDPTATSTTVSANGPACRSTQCTEHDDGHDKRERDDGELTRTGTGTSPRRSRGPNRKRSLSSVIVASRLHATPRGRRRARARPPGASLDVSCCAISSRKCATVARYSAPVRAHPGRTRPPYRRQARHRPRGDLLDRRRGPRHPTPREIHDRRHLRGAKPHRTRTAGSASAA